MQALLDEDGELPSSPKQIYIREISAMVASDLNARWHSLLPKIHWSNIVRNTHYVCYGFYYGTKALGVGIWSSPVAQNRFKDGKTMLELRRLALAPGCPKNTASWSISEMVVRIKVKFPEITRLISYQDTSVHEGTIYKASGWQRAGETEFVDWSNEKRKRSIAQSTGKKVRWERILKKHKTVEWE